MLKTLCNAQQMNCERETDELDELGAMFVFALSQAKKMAKKQFHLDTLLDIWVSNILLGSSVTQRAEQQDFATVNSRAIFKMI